MPKKQWTVEDNLYAACGETISVLSPGVYQPQAGGMFSPPMLKKIQLKSDKFITLKNSPSETVIAGIKRFWRSKAKFEANDVSFKRGILLEGPPGTGKTAIICDISTFFTEMGGAVILCPNTKFNLQSHFLKLIRHMHPDMPLLNVMEDLDVVVENNNAEEMSGFLDGEDQIDNIVHLATTNYIHDLDERFIKRPNRFDEIIKVGPLSKEARKQYIQKFITKIKVKDLNNMVNKTEGLSISHMRELIVSHHVMEHPLDPTIERLRGMIPNARIRSKYR